MFEKPQFRIETDETGLNYGRYKIEPLEPGYGTTLGNALRRILLRSLEGVAISRVQIEGVWHEFATINNVREDVVEIVKSPSFRGERVEARPSAVIGFFFEPSLQLFD